MATKNVKLTLEGLDFPNTLDHSKKNFRLLVEFLYINKDGDSAKILASLPPLTEDNWQWRNSEKRNYVPHDENGTILVEQIDAAERLILWDKVNLHQIDLKVIDIEDRDFWDYTKGILKELKDIGFGAVDNFKGGVFLKLLKPLVGEAKTKVDDVLKKLTENGNKILFRKSYTTPNSDFIPEGTITLSGAGTKGSYEVKLKVDFIGE